MALAVGGQATVPPQSECHMDKSNLIERIRYADAENNDHFREIISGFMEVTATSSKDVANLLDVSVPGVERWAAGKNCPTPGARRAVLERLLRKHEV